MILPTFSTLELLGFAVVLAPTTYAMIVGAPFVPTEMRQVARMLEAAELKPGMKVYDLGSGDGRLVHKASKNYGVEAVGYEFSPLVWLWAQFLRPVWRSRAKIKFGNFWKKDLSDADVIFCYLLTHSMNAMQTKIIPRLKPGAIIVSHAFRIEGLEPWKVLPRLKDEKLSPVWIYKVGVSRPVNPGEKVQTPKLQKKAPHPRKKTSQKTKRSK